jgi:hypothetical protein
MESLIFAALFIIAWLMYLSVRICFKTDYDRWIFIIIDLSMLTPVFNIVVAFGWGIICISNSRSKLNNNFLSRFLFSQTYKEQYEENE